MADLDELSLALREEFERVHRVLWGRGVLSDTFLVKSNLPDNLYAWFGYDCQEDVFLRGLCRYMTEVQLLGWCYFNLVLYRPS